jgi:nicotinamidase-related amidase
MSTTTRWAPRALMIVLLIAAGLLAPRAGATIIDEWPTIRTPPPPALKVPVIDRKTTALLVLDLNRQTCNQERRPRCVASLPSVQKLLAAARAAGVPVAFTLGGGGKPADILDDVKPQGDEPIFSSGLDKFVGTDLGAFLQRHGVKTVVVVGAAAHGAVLYTATTAAERGMQVVVPVDGIAAESTYAEQYTVWHLVNAPRIDKSVTLTTIDDVRF